MDEVWQAIHPLIDLSDLSGHAAWTPKVHAALKERLTELASVFLGHATAGGSGKPPLLSRDDFELLLRECRAMLRGNKAGERRCELAAADAPAERIGLAATARAAEAEALRLLTLTARRGARVLPHP